jgi:chromosomal replication initiator protein
MSILTVEEIWKKTCNELQKNLSSSTYSTWILTNPLTDFRLVGDDRAIAVITSPTAFHSTNVEKNFYAQIKEVLDGITGRNSELQFRVGEPVITKRELSFAEVPSVEVVTREQAEEISQTFSPALDQQFPSDALSISPTISSLQDRLRNLAQQDRVVPSAAQPAPTHFFQSPPPSPQNFQSFPASNASKDTRESGLFATSTVQSIALDRARLQAQRAGLRLDYTFETFAVSTTNEMAHAAAQAVSSQPGTAYNPLFIYGGVGVGKTHLMHAVGNNILKNNPEVKILYCTGEDFTNEIVSAIQNKKAFTFKEKFRNVDVLLLDDVQFIAGKNSVQEEFFHTFNAITKRFGQVILTSDQPPQEIALLEDRLRSRFEAGLMVDIQQPSFELRTAILLIKSNAYHLSIPMDLAQTVASKVDSARKIEGIMKMIKSEVELKHRTVDIDLINDVLRSTEIEKQKQKQRLRIKPHDIIRIVAEFYHLKPMTLRGQQRVKSIVRARHVAMFFLKTELQLPYVEIGRWFSNRDHTSVMHAMKKIHAEVEGDEELREEITNIRTDLVKISR